MIKPMSVGRGDAPKILEELLDKLPITLRLFRSWSVCNMTLTALCEVSDLKYDDEKIHLGRGKDSWVGIFTHIDRISDPTSFITEYCGPLDPTNWQSHHLRKRYSAYTWLGKSAHPSDTVVHISRPDKVELESSLLFLNFDSTTV